MKRLNVPLAKPGTPVTDSTTKLGFSSKLTTVVKLFLNSCSGSSQVHEIVNDVPAAAVAEQTKVEYMLFFISERFRLLCVIPTAELLAVIFDV